MATNSVATGVPDRGPALIGVLWPLAALSLVTAILRVIIRTRNRIFGWDDLFMIFAMLCLIAWSVSLTFYALHGGLQHIEDVQKSGLDNVSLVLFLKWLSQVFGTLGVAAGKISVSALLLAIIKLSGMRWQQIYLWSVTIILASLVAVSCSILTFAQCTPAEALWDMRVKGYCIDPHIMSSYGTFTGSFNTFADASLAIIPATIFWKLNSSPTEKMQLTIVFGLNILTSICSGIKTKYLVELSNRIDQTWATYDIVVWVTAELFLMIVCEFYKTKPQSLSRERQQPNSHPGKMLSYRLLVIEVPKRGPPLNEELRWGTMRVLINSLTILTQMIRG
ncbi:hypothetical protein FSARC_11503 [Fusarium sarcochroum]|uniref:Rhodopsin domain-containing protein n=1 Tax=Fusarium sarcochroum TaxID=1208366 RepID=A0A8H4X0G4_9HYPO|nr:hypothetical protein FSARC_11503 [Fusarium sarcochroum]